MFVCCRNFHEEAQKYQWIRMASYLEDRSIQVANKSGEWIITASSFSDSTVSSISVNWTRVVKHVWNILERNGKHRCIICMCSLLLTLAANLQRSFYYFLFSLKSCLARAWNHKGQGIFNLGFLPCQFPLAILTPDFLGGFLLLSTSSRGRVVFYWCIYQIMLYSVGVVL